MGRRIITQRFEGTAGVNTKDYYFDRLVKYIPGDVLGAWVAAQGLIKSASDVPQSLLLWVSFGVGVVLTGVWTLIQTNDGKKSEKKKPIAKTQILISMGAFVVWVFALGGPFVTLSDYRPVYGSLLLIFYTLLVAKLIPTEDQI